MARLSKRPADVCDPAKFKRYAFRFRGGMVSSGQPLASILGRLGGLNVRTIAAEMSEISGGANAGVKTAIHLYVDKATKNYYMELGAETFATALLKKAGLKTFPGSCEYAMELPQSAFEAALSAMPPARRPDRRCALAQLKSMGVKLKNGPV